MFKWGFIKIEIKTRCIPGTISMRTDNKQVLDKLQVERERGITVKAQTASMIYQHDGEKYLLNLIDTPVSRLQGN